MKALVLAAGLGTRLGELSREVPKPLLPIGGEPLLGHTLRYLSSHGYDDVAINLHFRPEQVRAFVGDGRRFGVRVTWSHEPTLLGTAGAVRALATFFAGERDFLVIYGDLFVDHDLAALREQHRGTGAAATLLLHQRAGSNSLVAMDADRRITGFIERPTDEQRRAAPFPWVNSGVQVLTPAIVDAIPAQGPCDLPRDVYVDVLRRLPLYGQPLAGTRVAIDSPARYAEAQAVFAERRRVAGR